MAAPTITLNSPTDASDQSPSGLVLNFTGSDADSNGIIYNLQIDTINTFDSTGSGPLYNLTSDQSDFFRVGTPGNFYDAMGRNTLDTGKWTQSLVGNGTATYSSAGVSLNLPSSTVTGDKAELAGDTTVDLTSEVAGINLIQRPNTATTSSYVYWLWIDTNNWLRFSMEQGTIYCQRKYAGSAATNGITADAGFARKWFRFRYAGIKIYWEVSTDGETWTDLYNENVLIAITDLTPIFTHEAFGSLTNPGSFVVKNFNIPRTRPSGTAVSFDCPDLASGTTHYWRVRGIDPNGGNVYGSWSSTYSFDTTGDSGSDAPYILKLFNGSTWDEVAVQSFS